MAASTAPGGCETQGSFQTWQVKQFGSPDENTSTVKQLDSWTTEFNDALSGKDKDPYGRDMSRRRASARRTTSPSATTSWPPPGTSRAPVPRRLGPARHRGGGDFIAPGTTIWATYWSPTQKNVSTRWTTPAASTCCGSTRPGRRGPEQLRLRWPGHWFDGQTDAVEHTKFGWVCRLRQRLGRLVVERAPEVERRHDGAPPRSPISSTLRGSGDLLQAVARSTARLIQGRPRPAHRAGRVGRSGTCQPSTGPGPSPPSCCAVTSSSGSWKGGRARARPTRRVGQRAQVGDLRA